MVILSEEFPYIIRNMRSIEYTIPFFIGSKDYVPKGKIVGTTIRGENYLSKNNYKSAYLPFLLDKVKVTIKNCKVNII